MGTHLSVANLILGRYNSSNTVIAYGRGKIEGKGEKGREEYSPRYVWDPDKLAWVETVQTVAPPDTPQQETPEETSEKVASKAASDEAVVTAPPRELPQPVVPEESAEETAAEAVPDEKIATHDAEGKELQYRGALIRLVSFVIDFVVLFIIIFIVGRIIAVWTSAPPVVGLVISAIYFVGFWTWRGQTPGKMVIRTRIVKSKSSSIGFLRALLRYIFYPIPLFTPIMFYTGHIPYISWVYICIGFIMVAFSRFKRGPHDLIAGTYVVSTRSGALTGVEAESDEPPEKEEVDAAKQG